jgi:hypothetical protein
MCQKDGLGYEEKFRIISSLNVTEFAEQHYTAGNHDYCDNSMPKHLVINPVDQNRGQAKTDE